MISCKKATELISKSQEEELTTQEALTLKIHLFICECCVQFQKQTDILRNALRRPPSDNPKALHKMSEALKNRIKGSIDKADGKPEKEQ